MLLYRSSIDIKKKLSKAVAPATKAGFIHIEPLIEVRKEPLVVNPSPFLMDSSKVTMNLIDKNQEPVHLLLRAARPLQDAV